MTYDVTRDQSITEVVINEKKKGPEFPGFDGLHWTRAEGRVLTSLCTSVRSEVFNLGKNYDVFVCLAGSLTSPSTTGLYRDRFQD